MVEQWIKMRVTLPRCPQVVRLASAFDADKCPLSVRTLSVVGALHATWSLFDQHSSDGLLRGYSLDAIDLVVGVPGWGRAMVEVGWLDVTPDGVKVCDWEKHNGTSSKRRLQEADRKRNVRKVSRETSALHADAERTPSYSYSYSLSSSPSDLSSGSEGESERETPPDPTPKSPRRGKGAACTLEEQLAEIEFATLRSDIVEAARAWSGYRRERRPRIPAWGPAQWRPTLRDAIQNPAAFVAGVQRSIRQGYQGLILEREAPSRPAAGANGRHQTTEGIFAAGRAAAELLGEDFETGAKLA